MDSSTGIEPRPNPWVMPAVVLGALTIVSFAGVAIAEQPDGAKKLTSFAAVIMATARLVPS